MDLDYFFYYSSHLATTLALACMGLACWRLAKVLRDRCFMIASWAVGAAAFLDAVCYTGFQLHNYIPRQLLQKWYTVSTEMVHVASACLFLFLVLFVCGAVRRSLMVGKVAEPPPTPAAPEN